MAKQTKKRTVGSFLSQRMKQQANESYDYLEENTRRVQSTPAEDYVQPSSSKKDTDRPIQGASAVPYAEPTYSPEQDEVSDLASETSLLYEKAFAHAEEETQKSSPPELAKVPAAESLKEEPAKPKQKQAAQKGREVPLREPTPDPVVQLDSKVSTDFEPQGGTEKVQAKEPDPIEAPTTELTFEPLNVQQIDLHPEPVELVNPTSAADPEVPASFSFEIKPAPPEAARAAVDQVADTPEIRKHTEVGDMDFVIPEKIFGLLVEGELPLRGVQVYMAMLRDAKFKFGGIATLSYSQLSSITKIQQPHIPSILKILIELNLVERFRAEKNATAKNSYIIL
ncbi:MAG: hypothetical protein M3Q07_13110 [Pseudobdellovibrionaceae bacterium]|nr:hypothetical protein [Pseudobdellovibrionaceae bacterium]